MKIIEEATKPEELREAQLEYGKLYRRQNKDGDLYMKVKFHDSAYRLVRLTDTAKDTVGTPYICGVGGISNERYVEVTHKVSFVFNGGDL